MSCERNLESFFPSIDVLMDGIGNIEDRLNEIREFAESAASVKYQDVDYETKRSELVKKAGDDAVRRDLQISHDEISKKIHGIFGKKRTALLWREIRIEDINKFISDIDIIGQSKRVSEYTGIGIFWAWDIEHAVGVDNIGKKGEDYVIESRVTCDDVDFYQTFIANISFNLSENEIRLKSNRLIRVIRICKWKHGNKKSLVDCHYINRMVRT